MFPLPLSEKDRPVWEAWLNKTHVTAIDLRILDTDNNLLTAITPTVNTGQVNLDTGGDVSRTCTLEFLDANRSLQFDTNSPNDSALYFDRMVQLRHVVRVPELNVTVACPIFTGPLVKFDRTGAQVNVEAQGKEALALTGVPTLTIKRGANAVVAIRTILEKRVGETLFSFPTLPARLPKDVTVSWEDNVSPWKICKQIADSINLQLYYDAAGTCRLRTLPDAAAYTFFTGPGGNINSLVQMSHDLSTVHNRIKVVGSSPSHSAVAVLADSNPLSAERLKINGIPRWLSHEVSAPHVRSRAAALKRAKAELSKENRMQFGITLNVLPTPHLDEKDLIHIVTDEYQGTERLQNFSLALTGGDMTIGFNELLTNPPNVRLP